VYGNGKLNDSFDVEVPTLAPDDAQKVSKTAYVKPSYTDVVKPHEEATPSPAPDVPAPMPAPAPAAHTAHPSQASALRDEAMRLMEEAKRLEAEANMAEGATEASA
jgi:hypothetical protein